MKFYISTLIKFAINSKKFIFLFLINLCLGLVGFFTVETLKGSLNQTIQDRAKLFLSADLAVQIRRQMRPEELDQVLRLAPADVQTTRLQEFFSMVSSGSNSRLVSVKAVEAQYPFYGSMTFTDGRRIGPGESQPLSEAALIWVYPEVLTYFGLKVGDTLRLGQVDFKIDGVVAEDSTQTFRLSTLAPRVYIGLSQVAATGLVSFGTTMSEVVLFKTPNEDSLAALQTAAKAQIKDSSFRIQNYREAGQDNGRALQFLTDYLGLVSLVALFLSALGTLFLFRSFLTSHMKMIAIWNAMGLTKWRIQMTLSFFIVAIGVVAALLSTLFSLLMMPFLTQALNALTPLKIDLSLRWDVLIELFFIGSLGGLFFVLPFLYSLKRVRATQLFQEASFQSENLKWKDVLFFLPFLLAYSALSVVQSKSYLIGLGFVGGLLVASLVLLLIGYGGLLLVAQVKTKKWWSYQALLYMKRKKGLSLAAIGAIGLGALLINLIPQLRSSLIGEFKAPDSKVLPSLFLFDIQEEQVDPLKELLAREQIVPGDFSPLIRARILQVNGKAFERAEATEGFETREEESERRFRNRGVNLSVRDRLSPAESVISGEYFAGPFDPATQDVPEISLEWDYARDVGLKLGDQVLFDVQGIEVLAQVTSLRRVNWNSFQPNFFVLFQPGVLDEAPKIYLTSIPKLADAEKDRLQNLIVKELPNVSMIDVGRSVTRFIEVADNMSWSLEAMALVSIFTGLFILFSMASRHAYQRRWDLNMFKILGSKNREVVQTYLFEFFSVGVLSAFIGISLSVGFSYVISVFVFQGRFTMNWSTPLVSLILISGLCALIPFLASRKILVEKPIVFLNSRD